MKPNEPIWDNTSSDLDIEPLRSSPDIVERLRRKTYDATLDIDPDCIEAADEIERLRAAQCSAGIEDVKLAYVKRWRTIVKLPAKYADEIVEALRTPDVAQPSLPTEPTQAMRDAAAYYLGSSLDIGPAWRAMLLALSSTDHEPGCQSGDFGPCDCSLSSPDRNNP